MLKLILVWFIFMRTTNHLKIINEVVVEKIGSEEGTLEQEQEWICKRTK